MNREISSNFHQRGCPVLESTHPRTTNPNHGYYKIMGDQNRSSGLDESEGEQRLRRHGPNSTLCALHHHNSGEGENHRWESHFDRSQAVRSQPLSKSPTMSRNQILAPNAEMATLRRAYAIDDNLEFFRTERMRTAYAVPMDEYRFPRRSLTPFRHSHEFPPTSPFVYHSAIVSDIPREIIDYQASVITTKEQNVAMDLSMKKKVLDRKTEATPSSNTIASSRKNPKNKRAQRQTPPKWKKAYSKAVKSHAKDDVGLILLGPEGPVLYAKVVQARRLPSGVSASPFLSFSNQVSERGVSQDQINGPGGDASVTDLAEKTYGLKVLVHADIQAEAGRKEMTEIKKVEGETRKKSVQTRQLDPPNEEISLSDPYSKLEESSGSWLELKCTRSDKNSTKQIFRAKKTEKYTRLSSCSSRSRTTDHEGDRITKWLKKDSGFYQEASSRSSKEKKRCSSEERRKMMKEAIPSIAAESREEHLKQLKQCIGTYVDFLQAKNEESTVETGGVEGGKTDDSKTVSTVQIDPSKLIDAVNHPLRRLTSDLTLTVTRSVTDALVGTDDAGTEPSAIKAFKKMRDKHFEKVQKEVENLFQLVRLVDSFSSLRRKAQ